MAYIRLIDHENATGALKEFYDWLAAHRGRHPEHRQAVESQTARQ